MTEIRRNRTREVVRAVTIVKVYRRPYPHHGNTSSCSRTLIVWKQSLEPRPTDLEALGMARSGRFELPTPRFVVWCSIQLSYERVAAGQKRPRRRRPHHRPSVCRWQARTLAGNARHFVGRSHAFSLAIMCANTTLCWFSIAADTG